MYWGGVCRPVSIDLILLHRLDSVYLKPRWPSVTVSPLFRRTYEVGNCKLPINKQANEHSQAWKRCLRAIRLYLLLRVIVISHWAASTDIRHPITLRAYSWWLTQEGQHVLKTSTFSYKHKKPCIFSLESLWKWKAIRIAKFTPNFLTVEKGLRQTAKGKRQIWVENFSG